MNPSTGAPTTGSAFSIGGLSGAGSCVARVTGTYTGALTPQTSADGITWVNVPTNGLTNLNGGPALTTIPSAANGVYSFSCVGQQAVRISANGAITGSVTIALYVNGNTAVQTTDYTLATSGNYTQLTRNRTSTAILSNQIQLLITYAHIDPDMDVRLDLINRSTRPSLIGQMESVTNYGLLDRATGLTKAISMFSGCTNSGFSGTIPPRLFLGNKITDISGMFANCWYLSGSIPAALLHNCTSLINMGVAGVTGTFSNCCSLISNPAVLRGDGELYMIPPGFFDKGAQI